MQAPPPGLRADLVVLAALKFIGRHEKVDGVPTRGAPHEVQS
jgi:hypothetical protein